MSSSISYLKVELEDWDKLQLDLTYVSDMDGLPVVCTHIWVSTVEVELMKGGEQIRKYARSTSLRKMSSVCVKGTYMNWAGKNWVGLLDWFDSKPKKEKDNLYLSTAHTNNWQWICNWVKYDIQVSKVNRRGSLYNHESRANQFILWSWVMNDTKRSERRISKWLLRDCSIT